MDDLISAFVAYLDVERGLAVNTRESDERDFRSYSLYLDARKIPIVRSSRTVIISYLLTPRASA